MQSATLRKTEPEKRVLGAADPNDRSNVVKDGR